MGLTASLPPRAPTDQMQPTDGLWLVRSVTLLMSKLHLAMLKNEMTNSKDIIFFLGLFPFGFVFAFACPAGGVFRPLTTFLGLGARFSRGLPPGVLTFPWNKKQNKKMSRICTERVRIRHSQEVRYMNFS